MTEAEWGELYSEATSQDNIRLVKGAFSTIASMLEDMFRAQGLTGSLRECMLLWAKKSPSNAMALPDLIVANDIRNTVIHYNQHSENSANRRWPDASKRAEAFRAMQRVLRSDQVGQIIAEEAELHVAAEPDNEFHDYADTLRAGEDQDNTYLETRLVIPFQQHSNSREGSRDRVRLAGTNFRTDGDFFILSDTHTTITMTPGFLLGREQLVSWYRSSHQFELTRPYAVNIVKMNDGSLSIQRDPSWETVRQLKARLKRLNELPARIVEVTGSSRHSVLSLKVLTADVAVVFSEATWFRRAAKRLRAMESVILDGRQRYAHPETMRTVGVRYALTVGLGPAAIDIPFVVKWIGRRD